MKSCTYKRPRHRRRKPDREDEYSFFPPYFLTAAKRLVRAHAIEESVRLARLTDGLLPQNVRRWREPAFGMIGDW
jgi:hypothetical protein